MRRILTACLAFFIAGALGLFLSLDAQQPVKVVDSNGAAVPLATTTELTHGAVAPTWTAVVGLPPIYRGSATAPTAVTAGQPTVGWANLNGAIGTFPVAMTAGGADTCYRASTASTNGVNCKPQAANVYDIQAINTTATIYYLEIYNNAGTPTCNTGIIEVIPIPASTSGAGVVRTFPVGRAYSTGVGICITANPDGTGNAAAGVYASLGVK